jgi:hypothetical protein
LRRGLSKHTDSMCGASIQHSDLSSDRNGSKKTIIINGISSERHVPNQLFRSSLQIIGGLPLFRKEESEAAQIWERFARDNRIE